MAVAQKNPEKKVVFPLDVWEKAEKIEDLEDWLLANDEEFIKKMRQSRQDDLAGKGRPWEEVKKELSIS
ncbi:MAG: hypothetical protein QME81_13865 [bacterium]|nr:hypothetical protein [bacterium]